MPSEEGRRRVPDTEIEHRHGVWPHGCPWNVRRSTPVMRNVRAEDRRPFGARRRTARVRPAEAEVDLVVTGPARDALDPRCRGPSGDQRHVVAPGAVQTVGAPPADGQVGVAPATDAVAARACLDVRWFVDAAQTIRPARAAEVGAPLVTSTV
jgi:hypothetical protein